MSPVVAYLCCRSVGAVFYTCMLTVKSRLCAKALRYRPLLLRGEAEARSNNISNLRTSFRFTISDSL